jgi:hypothetical protein
MNSKVVKGLFLMTILGLVGLLAAAGAAVAWAAQTADNAPYTADFLLDDGLDQPAYGFPGQMMHAPDGMMGRHRGPGGPGGWIDREAAHEQMQTAVADALGLTVEELQEALAEGQTPRQLAEDLGIDPAVLDEARTAVFAELVATAVAEGDLTQEQADLILEGQALMAQHRQEMRQWAEANADVLAEGQALRQTHREQMQQWAEENGLPQPGQMNRRGMRGGGMGHGGGFTP